MIKFYCTVFCILGISVSIYASGRKLPVVDEYQDVEIIQITHRGISIVHRDGGCVINVEKLSDKAQELLKEELEIYRKRQAEYKQKQEEQQHQLAQVSDGLSKQGGISVDKQDNEDIVAGIACYTINDYKTAFQHFLRAAEQGDVEGQYRVGRCYTKGEGVDKDFTQAFAWYQKSADAGYADALLELGHCYYKGRGIEKDGAKAIESYQKAIEKGNLKAYASLGWGHIEGSTFPQDLPLAIQYLQKGATLGEKLAQYNLGYCYHGGRGVKKDFPKAVFWFKKSAEQGFALAQFSLATCYFTGDVKISSTPVRPGQSSKTITGQNYSAAVIWYRKAAEQGYLPAQISLGVCYYNGLGVPKDMAQAAKLWADAAEKDDNDAQYRLATCYQNGTGVPQDSSQANYWFKKSAANGNKKASAELKLQNLQKLIPATNSKQERDIAYSVIERMAQGRTLEEIFSDPGLQAYTRQNRYLQSLLQILRRYEKNPPPTDYILAPATEKARRDWKEFMGE